MTLSNIDLMKLAKHYNINLNGIYMKDEMNGLKPKIGNYVINLESRTRGMHTATGMNLSAKEELTRSALKSGLSASMTIPAVMKPIAFWGAVGIVA